MRAASIGLCLTLVGFAAMAQNAPTSAPPPRTDARPLSPTAGADARPLSPTAGADINPSAPAPASPPGGKSGLAPKPDGAARRPGGEPRGGEAHQGESMVIPHADDAGHEPDEGAGGRPPPRPLPDELRPLPDRLRPLPDGKAAHIRIRSPDIGLDVKCPDDEPVRACVDALSVLIDKIAVPHR